MKKFSKRTLATVLFSSMLLASVGATNVYAASSATGQVNGVACSGYVSYKSTSATASTSLGANGSIDVTVTACCIINGSTKKIPASNHSSAGGTSARVTIDSGSVQGAKGRHDVVFAGQNWGANTTIGYTW